MGPDPSPENNPSTVPRPPGTLPVPVEWPYPFLSPPYRPGQLGRLGRYRVVKLLGEGGMGFVFRAEDDGLCRPVALKVMRPEIATQPTYRERFLRGDGRAAAAIKSDHVITIFEVGEANGVIFLAMEFLAGQNLDDWLKGQPTPAPVRAVVRVAKDVLKGLVAAHEKGLIHRDIKPANLWVETESNPIKLLDFGLTRNAGADRELTDTGQVLGAPTYMAPEQARGLAPDARADLFSVGVVLFRMITGKSPFILGEAFDPLPRVSSLGPGLPATLAELIDQLVAKRPEDRPESAKAALAVVLDAEQQIRTAPPTRSTRVPVVPAASPRPMPSDLSGSKVYALPDEDYPEPVPERKRRGPVRVWMVAVGVIVVAVIAASVEVWQGGKDRGGDGTTKEKAAGFAEDLGVVVSCGFSPFDVASDDGPGAWPTEEPSEDKPQVAPKGPTPREALLPGEIVETFEYAIEGQRQKDGKRRVLKLELAPGVTMEFVRINNGRFLMGAPAGEQGAVLDQKQHPVEISRDFYLGKYEVTQAEYRTITGESPSTFSGDDRLPVECVSWDDAVAFCDKLKAKTGRKAVLPSEAQWEFACRAGKKTPFHFGSKLNGDLANCNGNSPYGTDVEGNYKQKTVKVGSYPANPWGLHDMHGNVWEWCQDYYGPYDKLKQARNPIQLDNHSEGHRILRGGFWNGYASSCRAANRLRGTPDLRIVFVGFRVCLPLD